MAGQQNNIYSTIFYDTSNKNGNNEILQIQYM